MSGHAEPGEAGGGGQQCGTEPLADDTLREKRKKGAGFLFECVAILKSGTGKIRCGLVSGLGCQKKRAGRETCYLFGAFCASNFGQWPDLSLEPSPRERGREVFPKRRALFVHKRIAIRLVR